ncbi:hypothetical protein PSAC2689_10086 [Paraburkholderia sacchari]|uniref:AMP-binding enzyme n=1 Tax=Paraburkholderia sacchari TaxID=159450 RepID=UPI0039A4FEA9
MIVTGGENVYSAEVETALLRHPAVAMAAVLGVPHGCWGEAMLAAVVWRDGMLADEAASRAHCRMLLADYKVPKGVEFLSTLALTPIGKVAKTILRNRYRTRFVE